jgi:hypothetical protein
VSYVNDAGVIAIALGDNQEALYALHRVCDWKRERGAPDIAQHDALMAAAGLVWVIGSEDAAKARSILRAAGIDPYARAAGIDLEKKT